MRFGGGGSGSGTSHFLMYWVSSLNLVPNPNEFLNYNSLTSVATENSRELLMPSDIIIDDTDVSILTGSNDTDQVLTWRIDAVDTLKILTIPNGAGTADYSEDTEITVLDGERLSIIIEGGGAFTATLKSMNTRGLVA